MSKIKLVSDPLIPNIVLERVFTNDPDTSKYYKVTIAPEVPIEDALDFLENETKKHKTLLITPDVDASVTLEIL